MPIIDIGADSQPTPVNYNTKSNGIFESSPIAIKTGQSSVNFTFDSSGYAGSGRELELIVESSKDGSKWNHRATFFVPGTKIDPNDYWFSCGTEGEGFVRARVEFVNKDNTPSFSSEVTIT